MRKCYRCNKDKRECEFHNDKTQSGGLSYECKKCKSEFRKLRRQQNPEHYKEQQKRNLEKNFFSIRKSQKEFRERNRERLNAERQEKRKITPRTEKEKARTMMHWGIRLGYLIRPMQCEQCKKECKPEGHHEDYSKPLEVIWLCTLCHNHKHGKLLYIKP